jgi:futalosine hydrolase
MVPHRFPSSTLCVVAAVAELDAVIRGLCGDRAAPRLVGSEVPLWTPIEVVEGYWVVRTGVSKSNAAGATAAALAGREGTWDMVLTIGIGGTLVPEVKLGEVVIGTWDAFADEGVASPEGFTSLCDMGFGILNGKDRVDADPRAVQWLHSRVQACGVPVHLGGCATVSSCSGTDELAAGVVARTGALAESMEGAAVLLAAHHAGIAAGQVRIISNTCGERKSQKWDLRGALTMVQRVMGAIAAEHVI